MGVENLKIVVMNNAKMFLGRVDRAAPGREPKSLGGTSDPNAYYDLAKRSQTGSNEDRRA